MVVVLLSLTAAGCILDGLRHGPFHAHDQTRHEPLVVENARVMNGGQMGDHGRAAHCHQDVATLAERDLPIHLGIAKVTFSSASVSHAGYFYPVAVRPPIEAT